MYNSIILLGPTASGKTRLAAHLALEVKGAVLSFDSRQVYKELNIGAGKDLNEFKINDKIVPHYLIDICELNTNFHSYEFVKNYLKAFGDCKSKNLLPILCGGTGLYFDIILKKFQYINIPQNADLRKHLSLLNDLQLMSNLKSYDLAHTQHADTSTKKRMIRAIEIAGYLSENTHEVITYPELNPLIFCITLSPEERNKKINYRLQYRLEHGLIEEVQELLQAGIPPERLIFLGLEYKFITEYLLGKYNRETMYEKLEIAIHQYAKRQMTWFRKMEREGNKIHWLDGQNSLEEQLREIMKYWSQPEK